MSNGLANGQKTGGIFGINIITILNINCLGAWNTLGGELTGRGNWRKKKESSCTEILTVPLECTARLLHIIRLIFFQIPKTRTSKLTSTPSTSLFSYSYFCLNYKIPFNKTKM